MSYEFNSEIIDDQYKHVCEMLRSDLIICGGRKDGTLFLFDIKRNKEIGCISKHSSTIIDLKSSENNLVISVDIKGVVNIFKVKINSGEIDFLKLKTFKDSLGMDFHSSRICSSDS